VGALVLDAWKSRRDPEELEKLLSAHFSSFSRPLEQYVSEKFHKFVKNNFFKGSK
jgi:hypothetical protein